VERSDNDIKKVVFARDQFASSLNIYSESAYREFLCPKNLEVWNQVQRKVSEILGNKKRNDSPKGANNYYFFQHSSRFSPPKWTETLTSYAEVKSEGQLCMKAYIGK
ncbi:MAG: hypothetical protein KDD35_11450, partial [Bdellovibrionales bacterium]|nr:hypothetical protein [Bdellovibrionales bacterium]